MPFPVKVNDTMMGIHEGISIFSHRLVGVLNPSKIALKDATALVLFPALHEKEFKLLPRQIIVRRERGIQERITEKVL